MSNDSKDEVKVEFTKKEKRNISLFIAGIMCFKFAFESLGGSVNQFVLNRIPGVTTLALLVIFYGIAQSVGSILVSQLVRVFRASRVISFFIACFAGLGLLYILLEACTGGTQTTAGNWNPYGIFPIYICMGGCLGVMELVRRVIPSNIVGTNPDKLKKMDATVHIFYEIAGTSGAFASSPMLKFLGPVYATFLIPPLFLIGAAFYYHVQHDGPVDIQEDASKADQSKSERFVSVAKDGLVNYFTSLIYGAKIVLMHRQFAWLIFGYVIPLVIHRLVENLLFSLFAKQVLKDGSLSQILLGGSNFGELCGAALVLRFSKYVKSPLPWVRIDAVTLCVLWVFAYADASQATALACGLIPVMMVLSGAWAAGDVSLLAYIQSNLPEEEDESNKVSPLGAVMGFLYASYVVISTLLIYGLGRVFDYFIADGNVRGGFFWVAGVGITCFGVLIFASTFVPKGSFALNPDMSGLNRRTPDGEMENGKSLKSLPPSLANSTTDLLRKPSDLSSSTGVSSTSGGADTSGSMSDSAI